MAIAIKYLLDTNACIDLKNGHPYVTQHVEQTKAGTLSMSSVTWQELMYGAYNSEHVEHNKKRLYGISEFIPVLDYDSPAAEHAGRIHQVLKVKGQLIGAYDLQIAGHALALNLTLITNNTREFERIDGLYLEDWRKPFKT